MYKYRTEKWNVISPNIIGDFNVKEEGPYYGCLIDEKNAANRLYRFGRFNKEQQEDGLVTSAFESSLAFANYKDGKMISPNVVVYSDGDMSIVFDDASKLDLHFAYSGFDYFKFNKKGQRDGVLIHYDGQKGTISYQKYNNDELVATVAIPKTFLLKTPLKSVATPLYPKAIVPERFQLIANPSQSMVFNSDGGIIGIGVATAQEDLYSVGIWANKDRDGFQIADFGDHIAVLYGRGNNYLGPIVEMRDDGVFIMTDYKDGTGKVVHSGVIAIDEDGFELYDSSSGTIENGNPTLRIVDFNEISFDLQGDNNFTDYYYADQMLAEKPQPEVKIDPNDPEYKIMSLIGQEDVKKEFKRIRAYIQKNDASKIYKNLVFSGEAGVGKTTVAKLLTDVLYKYKAISYKTYFEKSAKELYNSVTGGTAENLDALLKTGRGGVILIDDVHYLDSMNSSDVSEGLFALAKIMEENPETVFILCDNKYNINHILENNSNLFQRLIRFHVNFVDFTREELGQILNIKLKEKGYTIEQDAMDKLLEIIFLSKAYGNNINATAAIAILEEVIVIQNVRTELIDDKTITKDDIDVYVIENDIAFIDQKTGFQSDARKKLDELVGLEQIKDTVDDLIAYFSINRGKKVDFHMCFSGNPGTGKTEVARIIGKLLRQEGVLPTSKFLEVTRKDLVGQYIGQTAILTRNIIDRAMGGVLYIDEAYSLAYGSDIGGGGKDFGTECVAELLKAMEDRRGEFCVILSGYTKEMQRLFELNPGFKSRVKFDIEFPDYSDEELEQILRLFLKRENANMSDANIKFLVKIVAVQRNYPNFANVRTLREALSKVQIKHARRMRTNPNDLDIDELSYEDIVNAFSKEEIDLATVEEVEQEQLPKLNPQSLMDLYKDSKKVPFEESKGYLSEAILALRMSKGKNGEGTGFIISKDGYFLTCAHCVDGAGEIKARRRLSHHGRYIDLFYDVSLISLDKQADIAICKINAEEGEEFDYLILADGDEQLDKLSKVYLMGYPFGVSRFDEMSINEGKITSYQRGNERVLAQINLDIQAKGGNSGSPLIDAETSKVIGILCGSAISRGHEITEEINYARPIDYVWKLLEKEFKENS